MKEQSGTTLRVGQTVSFYEILGRLGSGGMSEVYRARDVRLGREVALKVLPDSLVEDEQLLQRFEREARTLASLNHPNIGAIYGVGQVDDACFLVLELVPGEDLADRMARGPLPANEAIDIICQVADGLTAAHDAGIIHRDLKPANVVVTPDGRAKLLDFGLAKRLELEDQHSGERGSRLLDHAVTREGALVGTVDYMSPEQTRGRTLDERTDVWALGCLLFELLSGERIFPAETVNDKLAAIVADDPDWNALPDTTPSNVYSLLRRCLEKDRWKRMASSAAARRALEEVSSTQGVTKSIAVLPFSNTSGDPADEYFSDGVTEELINALSRLPGLRVTARTSSFAFKGQAVDVVEVGSKLGVAFVLEGSVRRAGNRVRITVQLVDTIYGYHVRSERFDREMGDIFDLQDEVANAIADALRVDLIGPRETRLVRRKTADTTAYDRFLKGQFLMEQRGSGLERALACYDSALDLDPNLAAAHAGRAEAFGLLGFLGMRRPREMMPRAREAALRALELDEDLAEAHSALGWVRFFYEWDSDGAGLAFERAMELDPQCISARGWHGAYVLSLAKGKHDEGIALCREATECDPLSTTAHALLASAQMFARRFEDARETVASMIDQHPTSYLLWHHMGVVHFNLERYEEARRHFQHAVSVSLMHAWAKASLGATFAKLGDSQRAEKVQEELVHESRTGYLSPLCLALVPACLGREDLALDYLDQAVRQRDGLVRILPAWRALDALEQDPRFDEVLERVGLERVALDRAA